MMMMMIMMMVMMMEKKKTMMTMEIKTEEDSAGGGRRPRAASVANRRDAAHHGKEGAAKGVGASIFATTMPSCRGASPLIGLGKLVRPRRRLPAAEELVLEGLGRRDPLPGVRIQHPPEEAEGRGGRGGASGKGLLEGLPWEALEHRQEVPQRQVLGRGRGGRGTEGRC